MPWPHKNSDGVISKDKIVDAWGVPKWEVEKLNNLIFGKPPKPLPNWAKPISPTTILKEEYLWGTGYQDKVNYIKKLMGDGVLSLDQADKLAKQLGVAVPMDNNPVLLPATQTVVHYWSDPKFEEHPTVVEPIKIKPMRMELRLELAGYTKKLGFAHAIDQTHNYTESELRAMLMKGFGQMTDMIIKEMKDIK